ncbi:MAG TPA: trypsin-like serine protease [Herpetosiphonaceae bacterium]
MALWNLPIHQRITKFVAGTLMLGALIVPAATVPAAAQTAPADPACLSGDPFQFASLRGHLTNPLPPRGVQRVNAQATVEFIGRGSMVEETPSLPQEPIEAGDENPVERENPPASAQTFNVFNTRTQNEFRVVLQAGAVGQIRECYQRNPDTQSPIPADFDPTFDQAPAPPQLSFEKADSGGGVISHGWSNASDQRVLRSDTEAYPLSAISQFRYSQNNHDSGCTGTLIGPRHLVTAAHCINKSGTNTWYTVHVTPGKDGAGTGTAQQPFGSSRLTPTTPDALYWTYPQWRDPNQSNRSRWDIGFIVLPDRLGDLAKWMDIAPRTSSQIRSYDNYNRGYPNCFGDGLTRGNRPANCQEARLYGDPNDCGARYFVNLDSDGWARRYDVKCDISAGHSGSPVYHYETINNKSRAVLSSVIITEECFTCSKLNTYVNTVRRVTPTVYDRSVAIREMLP